VKYDREELLLRKQMTFIGRTLICFPHVIRNSIDTISESAGSLSGLIGQDDQWNNEDREEFTRILSTIENQVNTLYRESSHLDRFARRMDKAFVTFNPVEIAEESVSFSSRSAHLRQASLELESAETVPFLYSDPIRIYFIVSVMIEDMLKRLENGGKVMVRVDRTDNEVLIGVQGNGVKDIAERSAEENGYYLPESRQAVEDLGGRFEAYEIGPGIKQTSLFLPVKHPPEDI
jgi:nitrogen fixation/metabolism regulation signal transduction histidine kinase